MLIAIIGGKLQGVEAVYLAQKAGWQTIVIDKNRKAPATGLCDRFLEFEFSFENPIPLDCPCVDFILPAIENENVLRLIKHWAQEKQTPLAFDLDAYLLSSSKQKSDILFKQMNLPVPKPWPDCNFPVVVKPDRASGSHGVQIFKDSKTFFSRFPKGSGLDNLVAQEYMEGLSYSIEVMGSPGNYKALQVTDLGMDASYDCKRVTAPTRLSSSYIQMFEDMSISIAQKISLTGIMDVEVVLHEDELKLLEIDARLPSQTPMTVFWSSGINMVEMLGNLILNKEHGNTDILDNDSLKNKKDENFVIVEHIRVKGSKISVLGERIMALEGPLTLQTGFFGANEAITSFSSDKNQWVATMIFCADSEDGAAEKRKNSYEHIIEFSRFTGSHACS
jgi:pyrrolysine biosynthesis protein PylC